MSDRNPSNNCRQRFCTKESGGGPESTPLVVHMTQATGRYAMPPSTVPIRHVRSEPFEQLPPKVLYKGIWRGSRVDAAGRPHDPSHREVRHAAEHGPHQACPIGTLRTIAAKGFVQRNLAGVQSRRRWSST